VESPIEGFDNGKRKARGLPYDYHVQSCVYHHRSLSNAPCRHFQLQRLLKVAISASTLHGDAEAKTVQNSRAALAAVRYGVHLGGHYAKARSVSTVSISRGVCLQDSTYPVTLLLQESEPYFVGRFHYFGIGNNHSFSTISSLECTLSVLVQKPEWAESRRIHRKVGAAADLTIKSLRTKELVSRSVKGQNYARCGS
jgi:hypothetical protein